MKCWTMCLLHQVQVWHCITFIIKLCYTVCEFKLSHWIRKSKIKRLNIICFVATNLEFIHLDLLRLYALSYRRKEKEKICIFFPSTLDYMCLTSRQSSPCDCLLELCEVTVHMVHTGQFVNTEWHDWLHHNCPRQESSLTEDLRHEKETCILHEKLDLENKGILKKRR